MTMKYPVFTLIIFLLYSISCTSPKETSGEEKDASSKVIEDIPAKVKTCLLVNEDFNYELMSNGIISAMNKAELRFQSQELITQIYVKNGQYVTKGQKLAEQDKFKFENALRQSKEALIRGELDMQDILIGQGYSISNLDNIPQEVMELAKIRSNYEQSQNNHLLAEYNLNNATLVAPFNGVIANLITKPYNQPGTDPFCTIIDNNFPEVVFNILESELEFVNLGEEVIASPFSINNYEVKGKITEINPVIDKNGMVRVKALLPNKDHKLYEGMNVKVRVQRLLDKRLSIPKSALVLRTNREVVFTLNEGKAIWNYVKTGQENSDRYVITEGLHPGDTVIYEGNFNLAHESRVELVQK